MAIVFMKTKRKRVKSNALDDAGVIFYDKAEFDRAYPVSPTCSIDFDQEYRVALNSRNKDYLLWRRS